MKLKDIAQQNGFDENDFTRFMKSSRIIAFEGLSMSSIADSDVPRAIDLYIKTLPEKEKIEAEALQAKKEEKTARIAERAAAIFEKSKQVIVTTGDLKCEYEVLGPVYFQVSNKGLFNNALDSLTKKYAAEIAAMKQSGTMSEARADWGFLYGEWSVGQNQFESAFYIATQELKKRAALVGGDAIIGMRQDIDLDSNGFSYFYLQMYGTAVKIKEKQD